MMRLDKYLTEMSVGSRSSVKKIIKSGRVYVDGKEVVKPETKIQAVKVKIKEKTRKIKEQIEEQKEDIKGKIDELKSDKK